MQFGTFLTKEAQEGNDWAFKITFNQYTNFQSSNELFNLFSH